MTNRTCWTGHEPCIYVREVEVNIDPETGETDTFEYYCVHPRSVRYVVKRCHSTPFAHVPRAGRLIENVKKEQDWCPCWRIRRFNK